MADPRLAQLTDDELGNALRGLAESVDWPRARLGPSGPDLATRVRARIVANPPAPIRRRWSWLPARRALVLAIVALLAVAAVAAAVGLGVPGIRLIFGPPEVTPPPVATVGPSGTVGLPGAGLGLGADMAADAVDERVDFPIRRPTDPAIPEPDVAYVNFRNHVTLVWAAGETLPPTADPRIGLLLTQFEGRVHPDSARKMIDAGTTVEPVTVGEQHGFWISGEVHVYFYEDLDGGFVEDSRRWVGDALIWTDGEITYRIESSLGRDATIRIAESLR